MMVSFLTSELAKWDALEQAPEALILTFFADERPLRGAAGLCDWRLCGRLSRMLGPRVAGAFGETTLYPPVVGGRKRLPFPRLVLVGLGPQDRFDEATARDAARRILETVGRLKMSRYAIAPPGRSTGRLSARRALELYLEEVRKAPAAASSGVAELLVVESPAGQKEAAELTRR